MYFFKRKRYANNQFSWSLGRSKSRKRTYKEADNRRNEFSPTYCNDSRFQINNSFNYFNKLVEINFCMSPIYTTPSIKFFVQQLSEDYDLNYRKIYKSRNKERKLK